MNDTSQTTRSGGNGSSVSPRAFTRSSTVTRGSERSRGWSWPYPTSIATTRAAPAWSRQSVKPPVDVQRVERVLELLPSTRDEARRSRNLEYGVVSDLLSRLVVAADEPGEHERLCLRARLRQSALDEHHVESLLHPRNDDDAVKRPRRAGRRRAASRSS